MPASQGRPTQEFPAFCGQRVDWHFCQAADPRAKGVVERLQDVMERSFEPGRRFANELDFAVQLDNWFEHRVNARVHKTLRARPIDRLAEERQGWRLCLRPCRTRRHNVLRDYVGRATATATARVPVSGPDRYEHRGQRGSRPLMLRRHTHSSVDHLSRHVGDQLSTK